MTTKTYYKISGNYLMQLLLSAARDRAWEAEYGEDPNMSKKFKRILVENYALEKCNPERKVIAVLNKGDVEPLENYQGQSAAPTRYYKVPENYLRALLIHSAFYDIYDSEFMESPEASDNFNEQFQKLSIFSLENSDRDVVKKLSHGSVELIGGEGDE